MPKKDKKSHSRAHGMTQISISLPEKLVEKIDRMAENEKRSRSNYIAYIIDIMPEAESNGVAFSRSEAREACAR